MSEWMVCVCVDFVGGNTVDDNSLWLQQFGLPWEVFHTRNADPEMVSFNDYYLVTKSGGLSGYQTLMVLVPELKGTLRGLSLVVIFASSGWCACS